MDRRRSRKRVFKPNHRQSESQAPPGGRIADRCSPMPRRVRRIASGAWRDGECQNGQAGPERHQEVQVGIHGAASGNPTNKRPTGPLRNCRGGRACGIEHRTLSSTRPVEVQTNLLGPGRGLRLWRQATGGGYPATGRHSSHPVPSVPPDFPKVRRRFRLRIVLRTADLIAPIFDLLHTG